MRRFDLFPTRRLKRRRALREGGDLGDLRIEVSTFVWSGDSAGVFAGDWGEVKALRLFVQPTKTSRNIEIIAVFVLARFIQPPYSGRISIRTWVATVRSNTDHQIAIIKLEEWARLTTNSHLSYIS